MIVMDLSETYRQIARQYFPNAIIVADRFHVVRLVNQHFMQLWKQHDPVGRRNRGLISLMRRHHWKLSSQQKARLEQYLAPYPAHALAATLKSWLEPIVRMWRFSKSNGITEGFHTKMEMLSRRAYGFRNFENYRLRVLAQCGWNGVINRVW